MSESIDKPAEKKESLLKRFFDLVEDIDRWIQKTLGDDATRRAMLMDLGLSPDLPKETPPKDYPPSGLPGINAYRNKEDPDEEAFLEAVKDLKSIYEAVHSFIKPYVDQETNADEQLLEEITHRCFELMSLNYLRVNYPILYWVAQPFGIIEEKLTVYGAGGTYPEKLTSLFKDIGNHFKSIGGGLDTQEEADAWMDTLSFPTALSLIITRHYIDNDWIPNPYYGWDPEPNSPTPQLDQVSSRTISFAFDDYNASFVLVPREHGGPGFLLALGGNFTIPAIPLWGNKALQIGLNANDAADIFVRLDKWQANPDVNAPKFSFKLVENTDESDQQTKKTKALVAKTDAQTGNVTTSEAELRWILGTEKGTHLELGPITFEAAISEEGLSLNVAFKDSAIVLKDGGSFVVEALGSQESRFSFDFGLGYKSGGNIFLEGSFDTGLKMIVPVSKSLGKARLQYLSISLDPELGDNKNRLALETTAALDIKLGPIKASMDQIGFQLALDFKAAEKNLGFADLDFGFKAPNLIGISVDAKTVSGGGFLKIEKDQYAGALELAIDHRINLKAFGLLSNKMPDGSAGYSLVLFITAEGFKWRLGYGFSVIGIGGIVAVNRRADSQALQSGLREGRLNHLLFPTNIAANAPEILSTLSKAFPAQPDNIIFGPMVKIVWGEPVTLITLNLALLLEFGIGDSLRLQKFILLGQLLAFLPTPDNDLIRIKVDALGIIDFDQELASFDARLYDSRLAKSFEITGEMAMRLSWGTNPSFALAVGGFHPGYMAPANFPALTRVAICFAKTDYLQLNCQAYLAITSNTLQFGARAALEARVGKVSLNGQFGYDALIVFEPYFHFIASFYASVAIKYRGYSLLSVSLSGELSGPEPLNFNGKASFGILLWDIDVRFNWTLIEGDAPPPPAPVEVIGKLKEALSSPTAWSASLPDLPLVSLRDNIPTGLMYIHPLSSLGVKQKVVPLNIEISRFGNAKPSDVYPKFNIVKAQIGETVIALDKSNESNKILDFFAIAQFTEMSDSEKLAAPSFNLLEAGVKFGSEMMTCGDAITTEINYEAKQIPEVKTKEISTPSTVEDIYISGGFTAVGRADIRRVGTRKFRAQPITIQKPSKEFVIRSIDPLLMDSSVMPVGDKKFQTWAEANDAFKTIQKLSRQYADKLQILTEIN